MDLETLKRTRPDLFQGMQAPKPEQLAAAGLDAPTMGPPLPTHEDRLNSLMPPGPAMDFSPAGIAKQQEYLRSTYGATLPQPAAPPWPLPASQEQTPEQIALGSRNAAPEAAQSPADLVKAELQKRASAPTTPAPTGTGPVQGLATKALPQPPEPSMNEAAPQAPAGGGSADERGFGTKFLGGLANTDIRMPGQLIYSWNPGGGTFNKVGQVEPRGPTQQQIGLEKEKIAATKESTAVKKQDKEAVVQESNNKELRQRMEKSYNDLTKENQAAQKGLDDADQAVSLIHSGDPVAAKAAILHTVRTAVGAGRINRQEIDAIAARGGLPGGFQKMEQWFLGDLNNAQRESLVKIGELAKKGHQATMDNNTAARRKAFEAANKDLIGKVPDSGGRIDAIFGARGGSQGGDSVGKGEAVYIGPNGERAAGPTNWTLAPGWRRE